MGQWRCSLWVNCRLSLPLPLLLFLFPVTPIGAVAVIYRLSAK